MQILIWRADSWAYCAAQVCLRRASLFRQSVTPITITQKPIQRPHFYTRYLVIIIVFIPVTQEVKG